MMAGHIGQEKHIVKPVKSPKVKHGMAFPWRGAAGDGFFEEHRGSAHLTRDSSHC
jgi:hypothetical protein